MPSGLGGTDGCGAVRKEALMNRTRRSVTTMEKGLVPSAHMISTPTPPVPAPWSICPTWPGREPDWH